MTSYQQIPIGIPVSQTPSSKSFPDEPEPLFSQPQTQAEAEAPSVDTNQQYDSQSFADGQPQASMESSQLIVAGNFLPEHEKIREIEARLNSGWYKAYHIWLEFGIGLSGYGSLIYSMVLVCVSSYLWNNGDQLLVFMMLILVTWCFWMLQQSIVMKNAMRDKNLEAARRGLKSMRLFAIYYFLTLLIMAGLLWKMEFQSRRTGFIELVGLFALAYPLPVFVQLYGATKVFKLLEMRENWVGILNNKCNHLLI